MIAVVRPLDTEALHHAVIEGCLGLPALPELHVGAASLQTGGVRHELRRAHRLHLPEELHGAAGDVLAFPDTFPRSKHGSMTSAAMMMMLTNLGS